MIPVMQVWKIQRKTGSSIKLYQVTIQQMCEILDMCLKWKLVPFRLSDFRSSSLFPPSPTIHYHSLPRSSPFAIIYRYLYNVLHRLHATAYTSVPQGDPIIIPQEDAIIIIYVHWGYGIVYTVE